MNHQFFQDFIIPKNLLHDLDRQTYQNQFKSCLAHCNHFLRDWMGNFLFKCLLLWCRAYRSRSSNRLKPDSSCLDLCKIQVSTAESPFCGYHFGSLYRNPHNVQYYRRTQYPSTCRSLAHAHHDHDRHYRDPLSEDMGKFHLNHGFMSYYDHSFPLFSKQSWDCIDQPNQFIHLWHCPLVFLRLVYSRHAWKQCF